MEAQQLELIDEGSVLTTKINVNSLTTAQAVSVLRLGLFTPSTRNKGSCSTNSRGVDVSEDFRSLDISKREGFTDIKIVGMRLNIETDFKIWCGIIRVFSMYGFNEKGVTLKFSEFAKLSGFKSKQLDLKLRERIEGSFIKLRSQTIKFSTKRIEKSHIGGLITNASFDIKTDRVHIVPDASLWELYNIDHIIMLKFEAMHKLQRMEAAQCLYMYLSALPKNPVPISFKRLRERMLLTSPQIKEQNRTITNAIKKLISIGYLEGQIASKTYDNGKKEKYLLVGERSPKLLLPSV